MLKHACAARGTLIVPMWTSAPFWPVLCPDGFHLAPFIHAWTSISFQPGMFLRGNSGFNFGDSLYADSVILALVLDFSIVPRVSKVGFCTHNPSGGCHDCSLT